MFTVFDLFAGAGGFGLGFELSKFKLEFSIEYDKWATDTLRFNNKKSIIIKDDIRNYIDNNSIRKVTQSIKPDVIIGGPPCQGFSIAGPVKDPNDPRNTLFMNFVKWVDVLRPKVFVMENVTGLLHRRNGKGEKVIDIIKKSFSELGYNVEVWNLNAANYGVPQHRQRIFIVGNIYGENLGIPSATHSATHDNLFNSTRPLVTVEQAIGDLPVILAGQGSEIMDYSTAPSSDFQTWARSNSNKVYNHVAMKHTKRLINRFEVIQNGVNINELPDNLKVRKRSGEGELSSAVYHSNYRHLKPTSVSFTIPASFYSTFIHPLYPRNLTSREAARLQSFPDWYIFQGKRTVISSKLLAKQGRDDQNHLSQYNQIGNAVPPLLAFNIAEHINNFLKYHIYILGNKDIPLLKSTAFNNAIINS